MCPWLLSHGGGQPGALRLLSADSPRVQGLPTTRHLDDEHITRHSYVLLYAAYRVNNAAQHRRPASRAEVAGMLQQAIGEGTRDHSRAAGVHITPCLAPCTRTPRTGATTLTDFRDAHAYTQPFYKLATTRFCHGPSGRQPIWELPSRKHGECGLLTRAAERTPVGPLASLCPAAPIGLRSSPACTARRELGAHPVTALSPNRPRLPWGRKPDIASMHQSTTHTSRLQPSPPSVHLVQDYL